MNIKKIKNELLVFSYKFYRDNLKRFVPKGVFKYTNRLILFLQIRRDNIMAEKKYLFNARSIKRLKLNNLTEVILPKTEKPLVSIVVLGWNKWQYGYHCLKTIAENVTDVEYEIIFIDNGSTDETSEMVKRIKNLVYICNDKNKGFGSGCNQGAREARGEYVVFLNNDTHILPGWLENLIKTFIEHENIGLVGSKLVYPNGRLQEAGGIVWKNKNAWNYGRFQRPNHYEFNYFKDVDYCSAASVILPTKLFLELGGFDDLFSPAYYEDTDLAFRVRQVGYRTTYQPKSEVIHFEGVTAGKDIKKGLKQYQEINKEKFFNRWAKVLEAENFNDTEEGPFLARDRSKGRKVMLFMDHNVPTYDRDAGSFIAFEYLKLFSQQGYKIIFWPHNLEKLEPYTEILQQLGIEVVYGFQGLSFDDFIIENGQYIDVAMVSRPHVAQAYLEKIKTNSNAKIIYIPHDLHYLREARAAEIVNSKEQMQEALETKKTELSIMEQSDVSLFFSDKEVEIVKKESPKINADVIPWIETLNNANGKSFQERKGLLFIGGFVHQPNADAVEWFYEEIYPRLKKTLPELQIKIIGNKPTEKIKNLDREDFQIKGFVQDEDLPQYFNEAKIFVAPLRFGAGFKGKIAKAMSYGLPVVTTDIGAEGIGLIDGENAMIANEAEQFANKIIELYQDVQLWEKLSKNSLGHLKDNYSLVAAEQKMNKIMESLKIL